MILYFEFDERRVKADVTWPKSDEPIVVHLTDKGLLAEFPEDLYFESDNTNKVTYTIEDPADKRLIELQSIIGRRLQELVAKT